MSPGWFPFPSPGDIVWCRFQQAKVGGPGPTPRPALVLRVGEAQSHPIAEVAYGTSRKIEELYAGEFAITPADGAAYAVAGLSFPTKFNLSATVELDYNDTWFAVPPGAPHGQAPKLGVLHPNLVRRARAAFNAAGRTGVRQAAAKYLVQLGPAPPPRDCIGMACTTAAVSLRGALVRRKLQRKGKRRRNP